MSEYKDFGWENAEFTDAHSYLLQPVLELLGDNKGIILDAGCGNGVVANYLMSKGHTVFGVDASEKGIEIASRKNPGKFYLCDFSSGNLPDELKKISFSTIISTEVIEHLYDPTKYITFCKRVLENSGGGDLIISTPYHGYWKSLGISICGKWDRHFCPSITGGHIKFWSKKTLEDLLNKEGFEVIDFKGCGRFPCLWKSMILKAHICSR